MCEKESESELSEQVRNGQCDHETLKTAVRESMCVIERVRVRVRE